MLQELRGGDATFFKFLLLFHLLFDTLLAGPVLLALLEPQLDLLALLLGLHDLLGWVTATTRRSRKTTLHVLRPLAARRNLLIRLSLRLQKRLHDLGHRLCDVLLLVNRLSRLRLLYLLCLRRPIVAANLVLSVWFVRSLLLLVPLLRLGRPLLLHRLVEEDRAAAVKIALTELTVVHVLLIVLLWVRLKLWLLHLLLPVLLLVVHLVITVLTHVHIVAAPLVVEAVLLASPAAKVVPLPALLIEIVVVVVLVMMVRARLGHVMLGCTLAALHLLRRLLIAVKHRLLR